MKYSALININKAVILTVSFALMLMAGCKKEWLDEKPTLSLVVPTTIADFQALLDNTTNSSGAYVTGGLAGLNLEQNLLTLIAGEEFNVEDATYELESMTVRNTYRFGQEIFTDANTSPDWNTPYKKIFYTNIIKEGIEKIKPNSNIDQIAWNQVMGSALFFRAFNHYEVAQGFAKAYDVATSNTDLGIPLRTKTDLNLQSQRGTVEETYQQILTDLRVARQILPIVKPNSTLYKLRPTKNAANAMLARVFTSMGEYDSAGKYADEALTDYSELMDYNIDVTGLFVPRFNQEVIFHTTANNSPYLDFLSIFVNQDLINLYSADDLRTSVFFIDFGGMRFKGGYDESATPFVGLTTDELFLVRAEYYARKGMVTQAMNDVNKLLEKRYMSGTFVPIVAANANEALEIVLRERRKELCFRSVRWSDLRRLNKDPQFAKTLTRTVLGEQRTLPANDPRYIFPIPPDVIQLSGIQQNVR